MCAEPGYRAGPRLGAMQGLFTVPVGIHQSTSVEPANTWEPRPTKEGVALP
jgi:hypothetical protein